MAPDTTTAPTYGVHSEVGKLRKVLVCAPGLAHRRLTPTNCDDLLFDDVLWVQNAQRDHFDFMTKMRERGTEVVELHNLVDNSLRSDVSPDENRFCAERSKLAFCLLRRSIAPHRPDRNALRAERGEAERNRFPDPSRSSRDEDRGAGEAHSPLGKGS